MAIRGLLWLALLFAIAVVLAVGGRFDTGQVMLIYPPYRVDVSLNLFVVAMVVLFIALYALLRIIRNIWRMPQRVAAYRARARVAKAHARCVRRSAICMRGAFRARKKPRRDALANGDNKGAAGLIAATAAHRMHEYARRDEWLAQIDENDWQDARLMATADMRADGRDADGALTALTEMQAQGGAAHSRAADHVARAAAIEELGRSAEARQDARKARGDSSGGGGASASARGGEPVARPAS